jgi:HEAT repeat protein
MNSVAVEAGIDRVARRLLNRRSIRKKLLAVVTLGQLRDKSQWEKLCQMALSDHALLSLAAAQALARIDRKEAVPIIVPLIVRRVDWPTAKVASILEEIGPDLVAKSLADAVMEAPVEEMQRLIPYLETCHDAIALPVVHRILKDPPHDKVIGPCLYVIGKFRDKNDIKLVRQYLTHPRWHVRAYAAACLGRIGTKEDETKLAALLADSEWWVRYRAAQAIMDLPFSSLERIRQLKEYRNDRYARDILEQVIAEKRLIRQ